MTSQGTCARGCACDSTAERSADRNPGSTLFVLLPVALCDRWVFLYIYVSSQTAYQGIMENLLRQPHLHINWSELKTLKADLKLLLKHLKLKTLLSISGKLTRADQSFACTAFCTQVQTQA